MMKQWLFLWTWVAAAATALGADAPPSLLTDGIPSIPADLRTEAGRYLEFRAATFQGWHPTRREMLITTRFANTPQLHLVRQPGGTRTQLTFLQEPVSAAAFQPVTGECVVFSQDTGGSEFYQLYRYDIGTGRITLLTDGKSRNTGARWDHQGKRIAFTSTRRNGRDTDVYIMNPQNPADTRCLLELTGGGWSVEDWAPDGSLLLLREYLSINRSHLHLVESGTGFKRKITPDEGVPVAYGQARFGPDKKTLLVTSDRDGEFQRLYRVELNLDRWQPLTGHISWDVDEFELSRDGRWIAFIANEDGAGVIHVINASNGKTVRGPKMPFGIPSRLQWRENAAEFAFSISTARSPSDVYSYDVKERTLHRWTESETGGLNAAAFVEPQRIRFKSFDGREISAFVYRPRPEDFPGPRPVIVNIHGGPESQFRPGYQGRNNFYTDVLGAVVVHPNVRGSSGYGKTFLTLDNGLRREDAVRDIGALLDWIQQEPLMDSRRIAVMGGSYGGYMTLASLVHFQERIRCGVDVVGISDFLTFLKNTQDYRRDLRRAEYGDERDENIRSFLARIAPLAHASEIKKPLLVVQGKNDPRVPVTEAEQIVKAVRKNNGVAWYLLGLDEGHGFSKKVNADYQFMATILFFNQFLLP